MLLLVRNRVKDAVRWKSVFDAQAAAGAAAGVDGQARVALGGRG